MPRIRKVNPVVVLSLHPRDVALIVAALEFRARKMWAFEANLFKQGMADGPAFESAAKKYDRHLRLARLVDGDPTALDEVE